MGEVRYSLFRTDNVGVSFNKHGPPPEVRAYLDCDGGVIGVKKQVSYGELGALLNHIMDDLEIQLRHYEAGTTTSKDD
jgi:hypothetical protein